MVSHAHVHTASPSALKTRHSAGLLSRRTGRLANVVSVAETMGPLNSTERRMSTEWELPDLRWLDAAGEKPVGDGAEEGLPSVNRLVMQCRGSCTAGPGSPQNPHLCTEEFLPSQHFRFPHSNLELGLQGAGTGITEQPCHTQGQGCGTEIQAIFSGKGVQTSDHDIHIWTERERRKKMNSMFSTLHSLLPRRTAKADKSTIVDEAISYIQSLDQTLSALKKLRFEFTAANVNVHAQIQNCDKLGRQTSVPLQLVPVGSDCEVMSSSTEEAGCISCPSGTGNPSFLTLSSPNVVLNVCGQDAFISICSSRQPRLLSRILYVMETHKLFVMNAHINSTDSSSLYMIHAQRTDASCQDLGEDYMKGALEDLSNCLRTR